MEPEHVVIYFNFSLVVEVCRVPVHVLTATFHLRVLQLTVREQLEEADLLAAKPATAALLQETLLYGSLHVERIQLRRVHYRPGVAHCRSHGLSDEDAGAAGRSLRIRLLFLHLGVVCLLGHL